jgi:hypothetical protein
MFGSSILDFITVIYCSNLFSNTLNLCSVLRARDQVTHPYKTRDNIIGLYVLIVRLLDRRQADKGF